MDHKIVYLVRHGDACDELTPRGVEQIKQTASRIQAELGSIENIMIYHSPLRRAVQSAQIIADGIKPIQATLQQRPELNCGKQSRFINDIVKTAQSPCIIVSHKPNLEGYLRTLCRYQPMTTGHYVKVEINT